MWRPSSASSDTRQRRRHDIKRQEKDDTITVKTYQNKLNSQSYSRLKMPTMAGRPTLSGPWKSVRLLELEATSNNANSRQASQRALGGKWWASVSSGQQQAAAGGCGKMRNNKVTQGTLALICARVYLGDIGVARVDSKGSGRARCSLPWQLVRLRAA
jgi:hypothetical protein